MKSLRKSLMSRTLGGIALSFPSLALLFLFLLPAAVVIAQQVPQPKMSDFVLFSGAGGPGTATCYSPGYAVQIGSGSTVSGGTIGSLKLIYTTGPVTVTGNVFSNGTIVLANSNVVKGNIAASNAFSASGTILSVGNNANLGLSTANTIDVKGKIVVAGGTVKSKVTHPAGTTYTGPAPAGGNITGTPVLPTFPALPPVTPFPAYSNTDITSTKTITPGSYGEVNLSGGKTLTLKGTGVYVFKEIKNYNSNNFVFDFENSPSGTFLIYVHKNVDLDKLGVTMINGGSASRIYTEVHGFGWSNKLYGFDIANGSPSGAATKWLGTVWCPYSAINIGSGTGSSNITGALWSGTQVNIRSNVTIVHAPFSSCVPPTLTVVNATVCSTEAGGNTAVVNLNDYITVAGSPTVTFSVNGSVIATPDAYVATNGNVITVIATSSPSCSTTRTFTVTVNDQQSFGICAPAAGKTNDLIGSELTSLNKIFNAGGHPTSSEVFFIIGDKVLIDIIYFPSGLSQLLTTLPAMGLTDYVVNDQVNEDGTLIITGFFPIANLTQLNPLGTQINYVRPTPPPIGNSGTVTTLGDKALRSDLVRLGYDIGGAGVKIGVLSDSYNTLANSDVSNGDLPGVGNPFGHLTPVEVIKEYPYGARTDEGRAMLQIIHDIAPEATLAFRTGFITANDFAKGIRDMQAADCDIITDDITYVTEPFFSDGIISKAVDDVTALGVSYFTAAGNFGSKSYEGTFSPTTVNGLVAHNYGNGDAGQSITVGPGANGPTTYTIVLQWQDPVFSIGASGTQNDLDIYLSADQGVTRFGFNRNNLGGDPVEILTFTIRENTTTDIMVVRAAGPDNVKFKYIVFRGDNIVFNEHNNNGNGYSTIVGQANSQGAMTVGAVLYSNTPAFNYSRPDGSEQFGVASFSSTGGTTINVADRIKPDFIAPNGVNTTVNLGGRDIDLPDNPGGDGLPNFFGTSAAAPHAAAVAALIMEARAKFQPSLPKFQPNEIRALLKSTARDMYANGYDVKSGAGFIRADQALLTIAAPDPAIINPLVVPQGVAPGDEPFTVLVNGINLNTNSEVLLRGTPLPTSYNEETGQLAAQVPVFEGNPPITVRNQSIANGDGGTSEPLYFFGTTKSRVVVKADVKSKKYGEKIPHYTASVLVEVNGNLLANYLTLADVGLTNNPAGEIDASGRNLVPVMISGPTNDLIDVNMTGYVLIPSHAQTDVTFRELFIYDTENYETGRLIVEKMPLNITPNSMTQVYGEKFDDLITFTYALGGSNYDLSHLDASTLQTILANVEQEHEAQLYDDGIAFVDSRQLVNASRQLVNSDLSNLAFMSSSRALVNSRQLVNASRQLVNTTTEVIDFDKQSIFNYRDAQTGNEPFVDTLTTPVVNSRQLVNRSRALVNSRQLVNGTALVSASRQLVNASRQLVNSNAGSALVNGSTVGEGQESSNADVLVIVDSLDVYSDPVMNDNGEEVYEIPQLFSINMVTGVTAGTHAIVPGAFLSGNFDISYGLGTLTVTQATLTVTSEDKTMTYGEDQPMYTSAIDGFVYEETEADVIQSISYKLKDTQGDLNPSTGAIDAGSYDIIPEVTLIETDLQPGLPVNYVVDYVFPAGKLTVSPIQLTVSANVGQSKIYGDPEPSALTYVITNGALIAGDEFSGLLEREPGENVGPYLINLGTLSPGGNYVVTYIPASFTITQRPITVAANVGQSKVYGNPDPDALAYTITVGSLMSGDSFTGNLERQPGENAGAYAILKGTLTLGGNYEISYVPANFTITPKPIIVTATPGQSKIYGDPDPASLTYTITDGSVLPGDLFTGELQRAAGANAGVYLISKGTLSLGNNYAITYVPANFTISPRAVTVTASAGQSKIYGNPDPASFAYSITSGVLISGDSFTGKLERAPGSNIGTYAINQGTLSLGANYTISFIPSNFAITSRPITVTANSGQFKIIGATDPVLTYSFADGALVTGDSFTGALSRVAGETIGTYPITIGTLALNGNYTLTFVPANFEIKSPPPPAIKSFATAVGSGSSSPKVNKPAGTTAGDLLVVGLMFEKGSGTTPTPPSGWTLVRRDNKLNYVGMATYYKVAGSNEPSTYTFTLSNGPKWSIGITRIEGADTNNPIAAHGGAYGHDDDYVKAPSINTTNYNSLVMAFYTNKKDATWTPPTGTTEVYDAPNTQQGLTSNMMAYYIRTQPGATGSKTATPSKKDVWVAQQIAINPGKDKSGSSSGRSNTPFADNAPAEDVRLFEDPESNAYAYPNPVRDHVTVLIDELTERPDNADINILDRIGRSYPVNSGWDAQNKALGLDFTPMGTGIYLIRVKVKAGFKTVRVVKESE